LALPLLSGAHVADARRSYPLPTLTVVHAGSQLPVAGGGVGLGGWTTVAVGRPERVLRRRGVLEAGWNCCCCCIFFSGKRTRGGGG